MLRFSSDCVDTEKNQVQSAKVQQRCRVGAGLSRGDCAGGAEVVQKVVQSRCRACRGGVAEVQR